MGYKFALILSREITDEETAILQDVTCAEVVFSADSLPTNAEVPVTKIDFDDTVTPSLAEAIESGLQAMTKVAGLSVPGLTVPAQPAEAPAEGSEVLVGEVIKSDAVPASDAMVSVAVETADAEETTDPVTAGV